MNAGRRRNAPPQGETTQGEVTRDEATQGDQPETFRLLKEYLQFQVDTSWYIHANENNAPELSYLTLGLSGEAGEFADEVKKIVRLCGQHNKYHFDQLMRNPVHRNTLEKEIGDVFWYLHRLIAFLGIDIRMLVVMNTYKLFHRIKKMDEYRDMEWPFTAISYQEAHDWFKEIGD